MDDRGAGSNVPASCEPMEPTKDGGLLCPTCGFRLGAVRQQIAAGTYETPQRIDAVVDRLLTELRGNG